MADRKLLKLRRDDSCSVCSRALPAGATAYWVKTERRVICSDCGGWAEASPPPSPAAGASARREHERRRAARENRTRERYGRVGASLARISRGPQSERAWERGARGEEANAARLERLLASQPVVLLHDRRVPGSRANIDHLAVGPGGVTVADSKNLKGKVRVDWKGGLFSPRRFDLYVGGRKRTRLLESVEAQMTVVRSVLEEEGITGIAIQGALCMMNVEELPLLKRLSVREVTVDGPRRVAKLIGKTGRPGRRRDSARCQNAEPSTAGRMRSKALHRVFATLGSARGPAGPSPLGLTRL